MERCNRHNWFSNPFYFQADQSTQTPDIIIKKGNVEAPNCSITTPNTYPRIITLPPEITNLSDEIIAGRIAHEFGHTIGLTDTTTLRECNNITSIMNISGAGCTRTSNKVKPRDVDSVNQAAGPNNNTCSKTMVTGGDSVGGGGGGGSSCPSSCGSVGPTCTGPVNY